MSVFIYSLNASSTGKVWHIHNPSAIDRDNHLAGICQLSAKRLCQIC